MTSRGSRNSLTRTDPVLRSTVDHATLVGCGSLAELTFQDASGYQVTRADHVCGGVQISRPMRFRPTNCRRQACPTENRTIPFSVGYASRSYREPCNEWLDESRVSNSPRSPDAHSPGPIMGFPIPRSIISPGRIRSCVTNRASKIVSPRSAHPRASDSSTSLASSIPDAAVVERPR